MPRGYSICSIRESTSLSEEQWMLVLNMMTAPCSVKGLSEGTGIERHTAEVIRYKVLSAISDFQQSVTVGNSVELCYTPVKYSEKGIRNAKKRPKWHMEAVFATDSEGNCIGKAVQSSDTEATVYDGVNLMTEVKNWLSDHRVTSAHIQDSNCDTITAWDKFISGFRGISSKYLTEYVNWFCYLRQKEVIGKNKKDIVSELWTLLNNTPQTVSNRSFRKRE